MKKVFVIVSIVLIIFVATVPCFAVSSDDYLLSFESLYSASDYVYHLSSVEWSYFQDYPIQVFKDHFYYIKFVSNFYDPTGNVWFFYHAQYLTPDFFTPTCRALSYANTYENGIILECNYDYDYFGWRNRSYIATGQEVVFSFLMIDLTSIYGDDIPTLEQFNQILDDFNVGFGVKGFHTYTNSTLSFNPFLEFYGSLLHSFDYFGSLVNTYSFPFVFVMGILFILLMIFVIACVIRRCRNI